MRKAWGLQCSCGNDRGVRTSLWEGVVREMLYGRCQIFRSGVSYQSKTRSEALGHSRRSTWATWRAQLCCYRREVLCTIEACLPIKFDELLQIRRLDRFKKKKTDVASVGQKTVKTGCEVVYILERRDKLGF